MPYLHLSLQFIIQWNGSTIQIKFSIHETIKMFQITIKWKIFQNINQLLKNQTYYIIYTTTLI